MKILFVGSNPSSSAATQNAFCVSTKSGRILLNWLSMLSLSNDYLFYFCNVSDKSTPSNRPLSIKEIKDNLQELSKKIEQIKPDKIIALGVVSSKALTLLQLPHYKMPHPSGLNRKLNNKSFLKNKIDELKSYITSL